LHALLAALDERERGRLERRAMPEFMEPMLATLSKRVFSDPAWVYEAKLDGQRSLLWRRGSSVKLLTRNRKDRTSHYPDLIAAVGRSPGPNLIADGEIVAFRGDLTSFSRLQERMQNSRPNPSQVAAVPVFYYLFDLLWFDGYDLSKLSLLARKSVLRSAIAFDDPLRVSEHADDDAELAFRMACQKGWEGLVAKRAAAPYTHGRSNDWLKFKCVNEQEFVVLGWTDPRASRSGFGALLVGVYEGGELRFAGKVGTGFDQRELERLTRRLRGLARKTPPIADTSAVQRTGVHWVRPQLVAQIGFGEWTGDGKLRHPRYLGLRDDKSARQVIRERT
jgi:bifunctional non-homologous end joining protein LigD